MRNHFRNVLSLGFAGFAIGWLVGLSVSPVLQTILESVLGIVTAAVAALVGVELTATTNAKDNKEDSAPPFNTKRHASDLRIDARPIALFCVLIALGASAGVFTRSNELLGPLPGLFVYRWQGTGLARSELLTKLFDVSLGSTSAQEKSKDEGNSRKDNSRDHVIPAAITPVLYDVSVADCDSLRLKPPAFLRTRLEQVLPSGPIKDAVNACSPSNIECLNVARELICANAK